MTDKKTRYCMHHLDCDRQEDCFNGESCPFFELDPSCRRITSTTEFKDFPEMMDEIWEGKQKEE